MHNIGNRKPCRRIAAAVALAVCLGTLPALARQNQNQEYQPPPTDQGQPAPPGQYGPDDPYSRGGDPQGLPPHQQGRPPYQGQPAYQSAPPALTLPAGIVISVRVSQWLSSDHSRVGDQFDAVLDRPVIVNGWVVARRGQTVLGRVAVSQKAGHGKKESQLGLELTELTLVDGQQLPLRTQLIQSSGGTTYGRDAATIGATTITGAAIGGAVGRGEGAGIGAAAGAAAGIIGVLLTPGKPTVIPPETQLTFRQETPLTISTVRSAQAFQPVDQQDYDYYGGTLNYRPQQRVVGAPPYYPPYPYYSNYYGPGYYPGWGYYPGPFFGFYGGYGYGPRVFIGPRFGGFGGRGRGRR